MQMLKQYLDELKKVRLLTRQEETELWYGYKTLGDIDCRQRLIENYQPLVFKIAMKWRLREFVVLDVIQEGTIGLIEAVEKYDPDKKVAFSIFASHRIYGQMVDYLKQEKGVECIPLDAPIEAQDGEKTFINFIEDKTAEITTKIEQNYLAEQLKKAFGRLPENERLVLSGVYIDDNEPKEIAATMDKSISYIYRLQKQGIRRLRGMLSRIMGNWH